MRGRPARAHLKRWFVKCGCSGRVLPTGHTCWRTDGGRPAEESIDERAQAKQVLQRADELAGGPDLSGCIEIRPLGRD